MIGLAIITGAAVGLVTGGESLGGALGLLAAALILALGMIVIVGVAMGLYALLQRRAARWQS
mgnify:CR=1 FL=1